MKVCAMSLFMLFFLYYVWSLQGGVHFQNHPVRLRTDYLSKCIPLTLHGDGPPCMGLGKAWGKMIDIWSWSSMLVLGSSNLTFFLIWCVHAVLRSVREGHCTLDVAFKKMVWSFTALYEGRWPIKDWNGVKILGSQANHVLE